MNNGAAESVSVVQFKLESCKLGFSRTNGEYESTVQIIFDDTLEMRQLKEMVEFMMAAVENKIGYSYND